MITYTDHILSDFPHTYLKMCDTPLAIDDSTSANRQRFFLDWSSNRRNNRFYISNPNLGLDLEFFSRNGYFKDSTPIGGIELPMSPQMGGFYAYQTPGALGNSNLLNQISTPESKYQYEMQYIGYSKYKHNKHVKVEFFLNSSFNAPYAGCAISGRIFAPMLKVGPISFWNSYYWKSPMVEGSCVTPERSYANSYVFRHCFSL